MTAKLSAQSAPQNIWTSTEFSDWITRITQFESSRLQDAKMTKQDRRDLIAELPQAVVRGITEFIVPAGNA